MSDTIETGKRHDMITSYKDIDNWIEKIIKQNEKE